MAAIDMREAVGPHQRLFAEDASEPTVVKMDINQMSAITYRFPPDRRSGGTSHQGGGRKSKPLGTSGGSGLCKYFRRPGKEIVVELIQDRIRGLGISEMQIIQLPPKLLFPAGSVERQGKI